MTSPAGSDASADSAGDEGTDARPVTLRHRVEYAAIRAFAAAVRVLGVRGGSALASALSRLHCLVDRRHVRIAETNLRERLGVEQGAAAKLARSSFRHLFLCAVEILHLEREIARRGLEDVISVEGGGHFDRALDGGRGAVFVTGHVGNWEVFARVAAARGIPVTTVYRPLDNPLLDRWVAGFRSAHGQRLLPKHGALRPLIRELREGRMVVLLVDQDARRHGILVPFLGRPASTLPTPAELALRTGAAIITGFALRTGPGFRHAARFDPPMDTSSTGDHEADVMRIMTEINARLAAAIRRAPEQWLWAHRRWKSSPPETASAEAASA